MEETTETKSGLNAPGEAAQSRQTRDEEATSKETLSDIEESHEAPPAVTADDATPDSDAATPAPSPDGQFDEPGTDSRSDADSGDPM